MGASGVWVGRLGDYAIVRLGLVCREVLSFVHESLLRKLYFARLRTDKETPNREASTKENPNVIITKYSFNWRNVRDVNASPLATAPHLIYPRTPSRNLQDNPSPQHPSKKLTCVAMATPISTAPDSSKQEYSGERGWSRWGCCALVAAGSPRPPLPSRHHARIVPKHKAEAHKLGTGGMCYTRRV